MASKQVRFPFYPEEVYMYDKQLKKIGDFIKFQIIDTKELQRDEKDPIVTFGKFNVEEREDYSPTI